MSFLANIQPANVSFYAQHAVESAASTIGISPNYYDHLRADISKGVIEFSRPIKDSDPYSPFKPADTFTLRDINNNHITHLFVAVEGTPVGYFIGGKLSNYEQALEGEYPGSHCETVRADLTLGDGTIATVNGKMPLQTSADVPFNFRKYSKDRKGPGSYSGKNFLTYGRASEQFAKAVDRPVVMSCAECVSKDLDNYGERSCRTSGELAIYITKLAFRGAGGNLIWLTIDELNIPNLKTGFVAVFKIGASDLRKPEYSLAATANLHVAPSATFAHDYVSRLYRSGDPAIVPAIETDLGYMQCIAVPTQMAIAELSKHYGNNKHVMLYSQTPGNDNLELNDRHAQLDAALSAYFSDRERAKNPDKDSVPLYVEPAPISTPTVVPQDLSALAKASSLFSGFNNNAA